MPESSDSALPNIEIADLVWQPAGADAPTLDLRGSNIRVAAGETLLISGASGAGKSTLAAAIAGLLGTLLPGTLSGTLRVGGVLVRQGLGLSALCRRIHEALRTSQASNTARAPE